MEVKIIEIFLHLCWKLVRKYDFHCYRIWRIQVKFHAINLYLNLHWLSSAQ